MKNLRRMEILVCEGSMHILQITVQKQGTMSGFTISDGQWFSGIFQKAPVIVENFPFQGYHLVSREPRLHYALGWIHD